MWVIILTMQVHDFDPSEVLQNLRSREARSVNNWFTNVLGREKKVLNYVGNNPNQLAQWGRVKGGTAATLSSFFKAAKANKIQGLGR